MKKGIATALLILFLLAVGAEDHKAILARMKSRESEILKIEKSENALMTKLEKLEGRTDFLSNKRREGYLNKMSALQHKKAENKKIYDELKARLRTVLQDDLEIMEKRMFTVLKSADASEMLVFLEEFFDKKNLFDFYFDEKIDIITTEDEPEDIVKAKLKLIGDKVNTYKDSIDKSRKMIKDIEAQIKFFKDTQIDILSGRTLRNETIDFLEKIVRYLEKDIENKERLSEFYKEQMRRMGG